LKEGGLRCPKLLVVYLASIPSCCVVLLMSLKASITTLPLTDYIGSMTRATKRGCSYSKLIYVFISTLDNQGPKPG